MPGIKALFLGLLLVSLALLAAVFFAKKAQPAQDAEVYAKQNPNCSTIKVHSSKNSLVECFLNFEAIEDFPQALQGADSLYIPMAKFIGERYPGEFPLRIRHVFSIPDEITDSIEIHGNTVIAAKGKSSRWRDKKSGCVFPGPCPASPLQRRERRGEAGAVNAIMPGKAMKIEYDDGLYSITIYHGGNIYSKTSGLASFDFECCEDDIEISPDSALGFMPQGSDIQLEITRNGKYETWERFYADTRNASP